MLSQIVKNQPARCRKRARRLNSVQLPLILVLLILSPVVVATMQPSANAQQPTGSQVVQVTVSDANIRSISPNLWSMNLNPNGYTTAEQFFAAYDPETIKRTGVKLLRFFGGCKSQYYDWRTPKLDSISNAGTAHAKRVVSYDVMSVKEALIIAKTVDARLLFEINISTTTDGADGCHDKPGFDSSVNDALDLLRTYPGIKFVELGNEPWFDWKPAVYADRVLAYATAIRQEFPHVRIAAPGLPAKAVVYDPKNERATRNAKVWSWVSRRLSDAQCSNGTEQVSCIDFLTVHQYGRTGYDPTVTASWNVPGVGAFYPIANYALAFENLKRTHQRGRVAITEWNMRCFGERTNKASPSLHTAEHGFYVMESQLLMARYNVKVATLLSLSAPPGAPCSILSTGTDLNVVGRMIELSAPLAGGFNTPTTVRSSPTQIVETDPSCVTVVMVTCVIGGEYPTVSSYSGYNRDRSKLYVYLLNKGTTSETSVVSLRLDRSVVQGTATMTRLSASAFTDASFAESETQIEVSSSNATSTRIVLPARSITRLEIPVTSISP